MGSFAGALDIPGGSAWPLRCYTAGYVEFTFGSMEYMPVFSDMDTRHKFLERLVLLDGFHLPMDESTLRRFPSVRTRSLTQQGELQKLLDALAWFVAEAKAA